jgi:hypothetical protein
MNELFGIAERSPTYEVIQWTLINWEISDLQSNPIRESPCALPAFDQVLLRKRYRLGRWKY